MTYYQFIHAVEEKIKKEVKEERKISVHTNIKNNGVKRTGIMISENGINISPTIYLEEYFQQFKRGYPLELIVKDILSLYEKIRFQNSWKECEKVKQKMLRRFDVVSADGISFYVRNKNASIVDDVLHLLFDVTYTEYEKKEIPKMEEMNTNIETEEKDGRNMGKPE